VKRFEILQKMADEKMKGKKKKKTKKYLNNLDKGLSGEKKDENPAKQRPGQNSLLN
jgi:hypothetical protein